MAQTLSAKNFGFDIVNDVVTTNKTVFLRCDFNVPIRNNQILDDSRILASLETINYLIKTGAKVVIGTHIGRPKNNDQSLSTKIIANYLDKKLRAQCYYVDDCIKGRNDIFKADYGDIVILENLRFYKQEEDCDMTFASILADGMNLFVNDAFSCSHRSHASILGIPIFIRPVAGFQLAKEISSLERIFKNNTKNTIAILGGSKVSTKIDILNNLTKKVRTLVIGGAMANTFLHYKGANIGNSLYEQNQEEKIKEIYQNAQENNCQIILPEEFVVSIKPENIAKKRNINISDIKSDDIILDVCVSFVEKLKPLFMASDAILWNGPLGLFEVEAFSHGTKALINLIADCSKKQQIITIAGGGDSVAAINTTDRFNDFSFVSNAGGAFLEYIEGRILPGIEVLKRLSSATLPY
jgi:phosphoglycerate kinase